MYFKVSLFGRFLQDPNSWFSNRPERCDLLNYITYISAQHFLTAVNSGQQHAAILQLEHRAQPAAKQGFSQKKLCFIHTT